MTSRRQSLLYSTIPRTRSGTTRAAQRDTGAGLPAGAGGGEWTEASLQLPREGTVRWGEQAEDGLVGARSVG